MQIDLNANSPIHNTPKREPLNIRLPFLTQPTGLGDAIHTATNAMGISQCGGCAKRAEALNQRVVFSPWQT